MSKCIARRRRVLGGAIVPVLCALEPLERRQLLSGAAQPVGTDPNEGILADFSGFANAYTAQLQSLQTKLHDTLNTASKVPFLNNQLGNLSAVDLFTTTVLNNMKTALNAVDLNNAAAVQNALFGVLGNSGGVNIIDDGGDGNSTIEAADIGVTPTATSLTVNLPLRRHVLNATVPLNFGLGLGGLPLMVKSTGAIKANIEIKAPSVGFTFNVGGATSFNPGQFQVHPVVTFGAGSEVKGTFGFFAATVSDRAGGSKFDGTFTLNNLTGTPNVTLAGSTDLRLTLALGAGEKFPGLGADMNLDWDWSSDLRGSEPEVEFPNVFISFGTFVSQIIKPIIEGAQYATLPAEPIIRFLKAPIPGLADATKALGLGEVSLQDLVKVFKGNLPPNWQSLVDLANTVVDVSAIINDFSLTGSNVKLNFGGFDLNDNNGDLRDLPNVNFGKLSSFGENLTTLSAGTGGPLSVGVILQKLADQLPANDPYLSGAQKMLQKLAIQAQNGASYDFPILDNPAGCVFKLLLGQDADLARFRAQFITEAGFKEDNIVPFKIFGYGIDLVGDVDIDASFKMAYDTLGLRRFLENVASGQPLQPGRILDGLYVEEGSHIHLGGSVKAQLNASIGIAGVTIEGGITRADAKIDIEDSDLDNLGDDNKVRLFTGDIDPDCMFHVSGQVDAGFKATVRVGVTVPDPTDPFGDDIFIGISKDLGSGVKTVFKWDTADANGCVKAPVGPANTPLPPPPVLAGVVGDGILLLYTGPNAHLRENVGDNIDNGENYLVTHLGGTAGDESLAVTAYGKTQNFEHIKSIQGYGGEFNDTILVAEGVLDPALLGGGNGDDTLTYLGTGIGDLSGFAGKDALTGGPGDDEIDGDNDDDLIQTGEGNNVVNGGSGKDSIIAGGGNDKLNGDEGDDQVYAAGGNDLINGGDDNDDLDAGPGQDTANGGNGNDTAQGGADNDLLNGDAGDDKIIGDLGDDTANGGTGKDIIFGDDVTFDGNNVGSLGAGGGADRLFGNNDNDFAFGQGGVDHIEGGAADDRIAAGDGNDHVIGGASAPVATDGSDHMLGEGGNDIMLGDDGIIGSVTLLGGEGNDTQSGGAGNDSIWGQAGNDNQSGDADNDYIEGNQGSDLINGGTDDDDLIGGSSISGTADAADQVTGGAGNDVIAGDNAQITSDSSIRNTPGTPAGTGVGLEDNSIIRNVTLLDLNTIGGNDNIAGNDGNDREWGGLGDDAMTGDAGDDDMVGNLGADAMDGGTGDDGMLGDNGTIVADLLDGSNAQNIHANDHKVSADIFTAGTKMRFVTLAEADTGSVDNMSGGTGQDFMHGGAAADQMQGNDGDDRIFGDAGNDLVTAGADNDHVFGGSGDDNLDGNSGNDIVYGGDGQDRLVADNEFDRLIDWFGNFNTFVVPGPGFGAKIIIRSPNPQMRAFLLALGTGDGATDPEGELVVVNPPSPGNSGPGARSSTLTTDWTPPVSYMVWDGGMMILPPEVFSDTNTVALEGLE